MEKLLLQNQLTVSAVSLGAMNFGTTVSKEEAYRTLDTYLDLGGNFIDTSNNYAHWQGTGDESETLLGEWLRDRGCRDRVVLATKVGFDRHGKGAGLRKEQIEYWIDESLKKLGTDYVDLYYAHTDDFDTPMEETLEAFDRLVQKGKVRALGASNFDTWRLAEANMLASRHGLTPYTAMQQRLTYLYSKASAAPKYRFNESVTRERLRFLYEKNMPLISYSCLCKGGYEDASRIPAEYETGERLAFLKEMAADKGVSTSALVVAWLTNLHRAEGYPRVIPLFSATSAHLVENLRGLDVTLTVEELDALNKAGC